MPNIKTITEQFRPTELSRLVRLVTDFEQKSLIEQRQIIDELVTSHALLNVQWGEGWRYKRARKIDSIQDVSKVGDTIWRPDSVAAAGRANAMGKPIMYLADRMDTALREIRLEKGNVVLAEFSIQPGKCCRVLPIGEMLFINRTGGGRLLKEYGRLINDFVNACKYEEAQAYLITDAFLNEVLVKDEHPYELSSYLCDALYKKYPEVKVISFPSAQQNGAINFAVRTDDFWDSWGVASVSKFYAEHIAQGFYAIKERINVTGIYTSGRLQWGEGSDDFRAGSLLHPLWTPSN